MHFKVKIYWNIACSIARRMGFVHAFIGREPAVMHINDQGLTNLKGNIMFYMKHKLGLFLDTSTAWMDSFNT